MYLVITKRTGIPCLMQSWGGLEVLSLWPQPLLLLVTSLSAALAWQLDLPISVAVPVTLSLYWYCGNSFQHLAFLGHLVSWTSFSWCYHRSSQPTKSSLTWQLWRTSIFILRCRRVLHGMGLFLATVIYKPPRHISWPVHHLDMPWSRWWVRKPSLGGGPLAWVSFSALSCRGLWQVLFHPVLFG